MIQEQTKELLASTIRRCEAMKQKFREGSSQHTLLVNRAAALRIALAAEENGGLGEYSLAELEAALPPLASIAHKTSKAQSKWGEEDRRYQPLICAMQTSQAAIEREIEARDHPAAP